MILNIFLLLVGISLVMIVIGLTKPEHTEQALIGFFFLFLLSFNILNGTLEYPVGTNTTVDYSYSGGNLTQTVEVERVEYTSYQSHNFGFWLALAAGVSLGMIFFNIKKTQWREE